MGIEITADTSKLSAALGRTSNEFSSIMRACVLQATSTLFTESRGQMSALIYNVPIPVSNTGRPLWRRTNTLLRNERFYFEKASGNSLTGLITNNTGYAYWRHEMKGEREAPWRNIAVQNKREAALNVFRDTIDAALKQRGL